MRIIDWKQLKNLQPDSHQHISQLERANTAGKIEPPARHPRYRLGTEQPKFGPHDRSATGIKQILDQVPAEFPVAMRHQKPQAQGPEIFARSAGINVFRGRLIDCRQQLSRLEADFDANVRARAVCDAADFPDGHSIQPVIEFDYIENILEERPRFAQEIGRDIRRIGVRPGYVVNLALSPLERFDTDVEPNPSQAQAPTFGHVDATGDEQVLVSFNCRELFSSPVPSKKPALAQRE